MGFCNFLFKKEIKKITPEQITPAPLKEETTEPTQEKVRAYKVKASLMTRMEKDFYTAIKAALPEGYILQPQVNLATIINKISDEKFQNELYRNIDFCIFDSDFKPLVLIEINDQTHNTERSRMARDYKVKDICASANIPLVIFWTQYGINTEYIKKRIDEALQN